MLGGDRDGTVTSLDRAGLSVTEHCPAAQRPYFGASKQRRHPGVQPIDDAVLPCDCFREIERWRRSDADAERVAAGRLGDLGEATGGGDHCLRRDTAAHQAGAAEPVALEKHRIEPELTG